MPPKAWKEKKKAAEVAEPEVKAEPKSKYPFKEGDVFRTHPVETDVYVITAIDVVGGNVMFAHDKSHPSNFLRETFVELRDRSEPVTIEQTTVRLKTGDFIFVENLKGKAKW